MIRKADISVKTRAGQWLALVEVKNLLRLGEQDAEELRDALVRHLAEAVPYLLVVSQGVGYLWKLRAATPGQAPDYGPAMVLDMTPVLRVYLGDANLTRRFRGTGLDLVLSLWLGDLARGRDQVLPETLQPDGLNAFLADIRDAQVELEAAA